MYEPFTEQVADWLIWLWRRAKITKVLGSSLKLANGCFFVLYTYLYFTATRMYTIIASLDHYITQFFDVFRCVLNIQLIA